MIRLACAKDTGCMAFVLGYSLAPVHESLLDFDRANPNKSLSLAPRGFGKSTIKTITRSLHEIVKDRNIRILIVSNTQHQAEAFLREIKGHMKSRIFRIFGDLAGRRGKSPAKWDAREVIVKGRTTVAKEPTITAASCGGAIISRHYDLIICDDIIDEENAGTLEQREKVKRWFFKTLMPCLEPDGAIHIVGTRFHYQDLYGHLMEHGYGDCHLVIKGIGEQGQSPWPNKFPIEVLEQMRTEMGTVIFNAQYQNDVRAMRGAIFKQEWFRYFTLEDFCDDGILKYQDEREERHSEEVTVFQGVDLAISEKDSADYFALVTVGIDRLKNVFVLDSFRDRLTFDKQMEAVKRIALQWKPVRIGIESVAYQAALPRELVRTTALPIKEVRRTRDKVTRALRLSALFENGKVFVGTHGRASSLTDELLFFPEGRHDDLFDALETAVTLATSGEPRIRVL